MREPLRHNISLIQLYLYARTGLAFVLGALFFVAFPGRFLGASFPDLYLGTSATYLSVCLVTLIFIPPARLEHSFNRLGGYLVIDVLAYLTMIHASGGVDSGLGYILLIFCAFAGVFIRGQLGFAFAAMVSLLLIGETVYLYQLDQANTKTIVSAGLLGVLLFATTFSFQALSEKLRVSNQEALAQARVAGNLQKLAQAIVARMRTGIIVMDTEGRLELINDSALRFLDMPPQSKYDDLFIKDIPALKVVTDEWQRNTIGPYQLIDLRAGIKARMSVANIDLGDSSRTVLFLEDHRVMTQQAQQLKLASLGRLTASIAHEVRNPLGAISHAAQLLAESKAIADEDKRLTEIIHQHSKRVNQIIESTLALSRRKEPQPETLDLTQWIPRFINLYKSGQTVSVEFKIGAGQHLVKIDPTHLSQVLTNLLDNGVRYSKELTGIAKVTLALRKTPNDDTSYLEVIDYGRGIADEHIDHIFDPFYTTEEKGSGLGLYISKELCEINQASLHYRQASHGGSCFRIDFSHHQRMF